MTNNCKHTKGKKATCKEMKRKAVLFWTKLWRPNLKNDKKRLMAIKKITVPTLITTGANSDVHVSRKTSIKDLILPTADLFTYKLRSVVCDPKVKTIYISLIGKATPENKQNKNTGTGVGKLPCKKGEFALYSVMTYNNSGQFSTISLLVPVDAQIGSGTGTQGIISTDSGDGTGNVICRPDDKSIKQSLTKGGLKPITYNICQPRKANKLNPRAGIFLKDSSIEG